MHQARQILHIVHRRFGQDSVAQIEDVAGAPGGEAEDFFRAPLQFLPVGKEQDGIEISLHGALVIEAGPALIEGNTPVESDHIGSSFVHGGKQRRAVSSEINDGHTGFLQLLHHAGDVGQHVAAIVFHAEATDPAVENLDDVGSGAHLIGGICRGDGNQLAHERVPVGGRVVHHLLGVNVVARASAFDHVAGESERGATETDHREPVAEMLRDQGHGFGDITEFCCTISAQVCDVLLAAHRLLDDRTFAR